MNIGHVFLMWVLSFAAAQGQDAVAPAQPADYRPVVKVKITVSAAEEIKSQIQEYMAVQFESLGDVQMVQDNPDWTIGIVTTKLTDSSGTMRALGISFLIQQHGPHMQMLQALAQACRYFVASGRMSDQALEYQMKRLLMGVSVLSEGDDLVIVTKHQMSVILPDKLPQACFDIVSALEKARFGETETTGPAVQNASEQAGAEGQ
ncbi:MAG: hypothetical protein JW741_08285 [Sedimentisphaerales bacterium]|nr:hypothetical protein [Sedimentisphaerales bacterium]